MKSIKFYKYIVLFLTLTFIISCEDEETSLPQLNLNIDDQQILNTHSLDINNVISLDDFVSNELLKEAVNQGEINLNDNPSTEEIAEAQATIMSQIQDGDLTLALVDPILIYGLLISNDQDGNFFEELIIQNKEINPTIGIRVMVDVSSLYSIYEVGRKIFISNIDENGNNLNLFLGLRDGVLALGGPTETDGGDNIEVSKINANLVNSAIIRSSEIKIITPRIVAIADLNDTTENIFLNLENMQFPRDLVLDGILATFASDDGDRFQGERLIMNCETGNAIEVSTSAFATYIAESLPNGQGAIHGILARNFFDDKYIFKLNNPSDIIFENGIEGRCDPEVLDTLECTTSSGGGNAFYEEDFDSFTNYADEGWTNVNVSGGTTEWVIGDFNDNFYAQISGFNSNENVINTWLVTPIINMDNTTGEELEFEVQANFDNGNILTVLVSTNFTGDVTTADWVLLDVAIPSGPESGFGDFEAVSPTNISCLDGNINIAFLYEGSDPSATTRYHIDNIKITGN